jgi:hypothetical protein
VSLLLHVGIFELVRAVIGGVGCISVMVPSSEIDNFIRVLSLG